MKQRTRWFLEHVSDVHEKWVVAIESVPFLIGRGEDCNVTLQSEWVSRLHAEIRTSSDLLWIRDLGSTNGTFVNHKQIEKTELLEPGDIISFGKFEFSVKRVDSGRHHLAECTLVLGLSEDLAQLASLEPLLRELIHERAVIPHFQPILKFSDMQVIGYEILGRIGEGELPSNPAQLFDIARCFDCASGLSALFREVGIDIAKGLPGCPLLFVNTDPVEMQEMNILVESLERVRDMASSNRIVLEISEKAVTDTLELQRFRDRMRSLDIGLAFDDFGVGQSRLVELAKSPPEFLKFDISLICQIHLAPKKLHQMVLTFVKGAQDLGIATLAEGIECPEEAETCRQLGFEYAQGYFYGRPLPINELTISPGTHLQ